MFWFETINFFESVILQPGLFLRVIPKLFKQKSTRHHIVIIADSLNFIPIALDQFSSAFGLQEEKGMFAFKGNVEQNLHNDMPPGYFPPEDQFCVESMSLSKYRKFKKWHQEQVDRYRMDQLVYSYKKEMIRYCINDTKVLRAGVLQYLQMFKQIRLVG